MGTLRRSAWTAARESLQIRYGILQVTYCFCTCALSGFAAIFLGYKGLSNSLIGVATGASCVLGVILMPLTSSAVERVPRLTIVAAVRWAMVGALACYAMLAAMPLSTGAIIALYAVANALVLAVAPLLSQLAMSFNHIGMPVNFGLARGMGSVSYAVGAVGLSGLTDFATPSSLAAAFALAGAVLLVVLATMPPCETSKCEGTEAPRAREAHRDDAGGAMREILQQRALVLVLVAFMVAFIACNCLSVYLIDIVTNLGGNTSMYGIATFCMAASELPAMAFVPRLRRRFSTGTLFMVVGVAYLLRNMIVVFATGVPMVFVGLLFQSMSYGMLTPLLTYYIAEVCSPRSEMLGQTLLSVVTTGIGSMVGTVCGGVLQDAFGLQAMLLFVAVNTVVAAAVFLLAGICARQTERR